MSFHSSLSFLSEALSYSSGRAEEKFLSLFFSLDFLALRCVFFKKNDNLKRSGRKSPAPPGFKKKKEKSGVGGENMTAVAEGDVTYCQGP